MNASIIRRLPHLHRIAEQRAAGLAWPLIAEKLRIDEDSIRFWVIAQPVWERLLADARREFAADLATQAMVALGRELQSDDAKLRMNAAIPLLRLHQTNLRHVAKPGKEEFPDDDDFAERSPPDDEDERVSFRENEGHAQPSATGESSVSETPPKAEYGCNGGSPPLPATIAKSETTSFRPPKPGFPKAGKIDFRRNMLLAPLISSKKTDRPPDGKRR